ncbi:hypothetical protein HNY73_012077 [Argiope bruennichi]|uniref:Gustatory receptor n=1 Tax=Argiope bruennichi TaxID=94029 RepID=A0A8T0EVU6_ARGBR|nr:hypothetical protein HNY73_012077 [Argiope bruennichi]
MSIYFLTTSLLSLKVGFYRLLCCCFSIYAWYALRKARKQLNFVFAAITNTNKFPLTKYEAFSLVYFYFFPVAFGIIGAVVNTVYNEYSFDVYGFETSTNIRIIFHFTRYTLLSLVNPTLPNFLLLLFCIICQRLSWQLNTITSAIQECPIPDFTLIKQADILQRYSRLNDIVDVMKMVFSVPLFFICVSHFGFSIIILGGIILNGYMFAGNYLMLIRKVMILLSTFAGLLAFLWIAGGLPDEEERMKDAFQRKIQKRRISQPISNEICLKKYMSEKTNFVFSMCNIIHFRRSSIAALAGTILTYTIVLVSKD